MRSDTWRAISTNVIVLQFNFSVKFAIEFFFKLHFIATCTTRKLHKIGVTK